MPDESVKERGKGKVIMRRNYHTSGRSNHVTQAKCNLKQFFSLKLASDKEKNKKLVRI